MSGGGVTPKAAREAEERAREKRSARIYTICAVAFVVLAVALVVYNSGIRDTIKRGKTAVTIDGNSFTAGEVSYYYGSAYSQMAQYGAYVGLDTSKSLKSQMAWGGEEQTWDEYFKDQAVESMKMVSAAKNSGMKLEDADLETVKANVSAMQEQASAYGYTYQQFLTANFGSLMTPSIFESCLKDVVLASKYEQDHADKLSFSEEEIDKYYSENKNSYDLVDGGYIVISGAAESTTDAEGNTVEPTDEAKAQAMETAKTLAQSLLDRVQAGQDMAELAEENSATYTGGTELNYSVNMAMDWLFDESRKGGDAEVLEDAEGSTVYVVRFNGRKLDETPGYTVRHVLVTKDNLDLNEGEEPAEGQILAKAEEILSGWDGTEDGFANLAKEYSQDGNAEQGGIYEDVPKGMMVAAFQDWCYEEGRKPGDTGIVETTYGQHIMYFVGYTDTQYWHYACENALKNNAQSEWQKGIADNAAVELAGGMDSVGM